MHEAHTWEQYPQALGRGEDFDDMGASQAFDWDDKGDIPLESAVFSTGLVPIEKRKYITVNDPM